MDNYQKGQWNAICDVCGFEFKAKELRKRWDGFMVCKEDFEHRHPSDFQRGREERSAVPWARPDDTEGNITIINVTNGVAYLLEASLENNLYYFTTRGAGINRTVSLPDPSNAGFKGINTIYKITLLYIDPVSGENSNAPITINNTLIEGSNEISFGVTAAFENSVSSNTWRRIF